MKLLSVSRVMLIVHLCLSHVGLARDIQNLVVLPAPVPVFPQQIARIEISDRVTAQKIVQAAKNNALAIVAVDSDKVTLAATLSQLVSNAFYSGVRGSLIDVSSPNGKDVELIVQGEERIGIQHFEAGPDGIWYAACEPFSFDDDAHTMRAQESFIAIKQLGVRGLEMAQAIPGVDTNVIESFAGLATVATPHQLPYYFFQLGLDVQNMQRLLVCASTSSMLEAAHLLLSNHLTSFFVKKALLSSGEENQNLVQSAASGAHGGAQKDDLTERLSKLKVPDEIRKEIDRENALLQGMMPHFPEAQKVREYLELVADLPWDTFSEDMTDLSQARAILHEDHYKLTEIKERIIEFLAVRSLKKDGKPPILCFVGPPGVGKTSLAKSIARCLGRKFQRIALGGVCDEAEIRGFRRTYTGAMPGRFIERMRKAGTMNPVICLDEIDKVEAAKGNPASALLEVLDPEQNGAFVDSYLALPFDLSQVLFVATANTLETIPAPLRDRMEIIPVSSYTRQEKYRIAQDFLIKKAHAAAGLVEPVHFSDEVLYDIIDHYTCEAGVRGLERMLTKLCQKVARYRVEEQRTPSITTDTLVDLLGPDRMIFDEVSKTDTVGVTHGLSWSPVGGKVLNIETVIMPGKGKLQLTGSLGSVMKESAEMVLSYIKAHAEDYGIAPERFTQYDMHIHVPAGGTPKDGPSAGVSLLSSMVSALTERPVNGTYAMTGEMNLRGVVMPVGGIKEKVLAAKRHNISHVLLPAANKNDLLKEPECAEGITLTWVEQAEDVLRLVLGDVIAS